MINKIYNEDCLETMARMPDNFVDLVLTDPPYGIGICSTGSVGGKKMAITKDYGEQKWDNEIPKKEVFEQMFRISKNQIIFGGNYFVEYLKNSSCWLVWDKDNSGNFADCELLWTSFNTAVRKFKFRWNGLLQEDMKNKEVRYHPTQKPVELMRQILSRYSNPNQIIYDPFIGSGSILLAAQKLGHEWIGSEINKEYCDIANKRIDAERNQMKLLFDF